MKRNIYTIITALLVSIISPVAAQTPEKEVKLGDMTFVRQSFVRNFYTSAKVMSQINMEGTNLFLQNSANIIIESHDAQPQLKQMGRKLHIMAKDSTVDATLRVGAFHPYLCYEASHRRQKLLPNFPFHQEKDCLVL